jgi:hypothetical protein
MAVVQWLSILPNILQIYNSSLIDEIDVDWTNGIV